MDKCPDAPSSLASASQVHELERPRYCRPANGAVNSFVKFNWISSTPQSAGTFPVPRFHSPLSTDETQLVASAGAFSYALTSVNPLSLTTGPQLTVFTPPASLDTALPVDSTVYATPLPSRSQMISPQPTMPVEFPKPMPSSLGLYVKMSAIDKKLWDFYMYNWSPGRSILEPNIWKDFAQMHSNSGIIAAILSLAGLYVYDYNPQISIKSRVEALLAEAKGCLDALIMDPVRVETDSNASDELMTLFVVLSMQDIVRPESRRKTPDPPRWLEGFNNCERIIQRTDQGARFWNKHKTEPTSLRKSLLVTVGNTLILSQILEPLPRPHEFDFKKEEPRFGWLLYGTREQTYEIHPGCGFSRKLLHVIRQITFWSARLQQERESPMAQAMTKALYGELNKMKQWAPDVQEWELANAIPMPVDHLKNRPGSQVNTWKGVALFTAEAWRIAAMIYLQCRLMRLPPKHADVMSNLQDLCLCIRAMPTQGNYFTAQAPLFPVFLLWLLASTEDHRSAADDWFQAVVNAPMRSSVRPLFEGLKRIREHWTPPTCDHLPPAIRNRQAWWESLVKKILEQQDERFCLT
ncbi:fungal-specific transcription factor domain-containing protein [Stachybotrys elegans]|uniref:Fungal-specific transcription factor domain-containing protein n=1 Tax=Stachybotrys elegans TaxID=80388 RepID=A0A8K0SG75_9HYPO|nr:fungal-specific transcription factor domain-containing protein [Stachybotrys elegans]